MKNLVLILISSVIFTSFFLAGWYLRGRNTNKDNALSKLEEAVTPKPLLKYEIETLSNVDVKSNDIKIKETISEEDEYTSYLFEHKFNPTLADDDEKTVTGQINLPIGNKKYPLVLMIRGYVDQKIYTTGIGTKNGAKFFAENGFITLAPDFLGYAGSTIESSNIFESRFQTYTTVLSLLSSLDHIKEWDGKNIFIWAHSNGGQIALTTLAITGKEIPTTLWAPVTKPFPYSVLYYTDESIDGGKFIRLKLSEFEELYDVEKYNFLNYIDRIKAPIHLHQGGTDDAIPLSWSQSFAKRLENKEKDIKLFTYPFADHNMQPNWNDAILSDLEFFRKYMQ